MKKILEKLENPRIMFCIFMAIIHIALFIINITRFTTICRRIYNGQKACGCNKSTEIEENNKKK